MLEIFFQFQAWLAFAVGVVLLGFGVAKRKPSLISLGALACVELGLLVQLISSIIMVAGEQERRLTPSSSSLISWSLSSCQSVPHSGR